jgi:hypothetical protein
MSPNFKIILHRNPAVTAWLDDGDEDWERCYVGGDGDNGDVEDGHRSSFSGGGGGYAEGGPDLEGNASGHIPSENRP